MKIFLFVFSLILIINFSFLSVVFFIDIFIKKRINEYLDIFHKEKLLNIDKKISFIDKKMELDDPKFINLKQEAISFYEDFFVVNNIQFKNKIIIMIKNDLGVMTKIKSNLAIIDEMQMITEKHNLFLTHQYALIEQLNNYYFIYGNIFLNFKDMILFVKETFQINSIELPKKYEIALEELSMDLSKLENDFDFLTTSFFDEMEKTWTKFLILLKEINEYVRIQIDYKIIREFMESYSLFLINPLKENDLFLNLSSNLKRTIFHFFENLQERLELIGQEYEQNNDINFLDESLNNFKKDAEETMNFISNNIRLSNLFQKVNKLISFIPNEVKAKTTLICKELELKQISNQEEIDKLKNLSEEISNQYLKMMNFKKNNFDYLEEKLDLYIEFIDEFKVYNEISFLSTEKIKEFNNDKKMMSIRIEKTNDKLIDCTSKINFMPKVYKNKYEKIINKYTLFIEKLRIKNNDEFTKVDETDLDVLQNWNQTIDQIVQDVYSDLYVIKFIQNSLEILKKHRDDKNELSYFINVIEESFLGGELSSTLRLITKVLKLYDIYEK